MESREFDLIFKISSRKRKRNRYPYLRKKNCLEFSASHFRSLQISDICSLHTAYGFIPFIILVVQFLIAIESVKSALHYKSFYINNFILF